MKNLVLFGDSLFGKFGRDYIHKLEEKLKDTTVYNCAAGGFDTRDGVKRADYIARLKPELVCLSFGANDGNPFKGTPVSLEDFKANMRKIIKSFSESKIILFPCPPATDENEEEAEKFNSIISKYNDVLSRLAIETNSKCIDSENIYKELGQKGVVYHIEDGLHLNEVGYDVLIEQIARFQ